MSHCLGQLNPPLLWPHITFPTCPNIPDIFVNPWTGEHMVGYSFSVGTNDNDRFFNITNNLIFLDNKRRDISNANISGTNLTFTYTNNNQSYDYTLQFSPQNIHGNNIQVVSGAYASAAPNKTINERFTTTSTQNIWYWILFIIVIIFIIYLIYQRKKNI